MFLFLISNTERRTSLKLLNNSGSVTGRHPSLLRIAHALAFLFVANFLQAYNLLDCNRRNPEYIIYPSTHP